MYDAKEVKVSADDIVKQNENERYTMLWEELVIGKYNIEKEIRDKVSQGLYELSIEIPISVKYPDRSYRSYHGDVKVYLNPSKDGYEFSTLTSCLQFFGYSTTCEVESGDVFVELMISW